MHSYVEMILILPLLVLCLQFYSFSVKSKGEVRQDRCQKLGIGFMTLGIVSLAFKTVPSAFLGLILMMFGFRLISKGLDSIREEKAPLQHDE